MKLLPVLAIVLSLLSTPAMAKKRRKKSNNAAKICRILKSVKRMCDGKDYDDEYYACVVAGMSRSGYKVGTHYRENDYVFSCK